MSDNQASLNAMVASLAQRDLRPNRSISKTQVQNLVQHVVEQINKSTFTQFDPVLVDSDSNAGSGGWVTFDVSAYVPEGVTSAYVYCFATSKTQADEVIIEFRRDSAAGTSGVYPGARTESIDGPQDADRDSIARFIPVSSSRTIDYQVRGTFTNAATQWAIYLEGYM